MALSENVKDYFKGFSKLNLNERLARLVKMGALKKEDVSFLQKNRGLDTELAEHFIENVIGYFHLPLGVVTNFNIDSKDYVIPMAVEETSIIAAASKTARWVRETGSITTRMIGNTIIGQIQIATVKDIDKLTSVLEKNKLFLIESANENAAASLVKRGGGVTDLHLRTLDRDDGKQMAVIHVHANTCDAMGANLINQVCEFLRQPIENLTGETVTMCILSNLIDTKLTEATITMHGIDPVLGQKIEEASLFAELDPYRATTSNKGVLNGIDPILIATGNDWRAVEAAIHAYATRKGRYQSITCWRYHQGTLTGTLTAPIAVGTVGGMTKLHPTAKMCLEMLDISTASDLSRIVASVGLVQNLGAITALTTVGIIQGHMKLHISNLSLAAGAKESERPQLHKKLEELLKIKKRITVSNAIDILKDLRDKGKKLKDTLESKAKQL